MEYVGYILAFVLILFLSYYATKLLGRKLTGGTKNKFMKITEMLPLGLDRCLYLIRVGNKHFLFYSTKKELNLVSEIDIDWEAEEVPESQEPSFSFKAIFQNYSGLGRHSENSSGTSQEDTDHNPVSRIVQNIRRLQKITKDIR